MGLKFRKSKKIAPGVRLNFSKKGMGVSFGGKHARYSISPTGRRTTSFRIAPGLTYSKSSGGRKRARKANTTYYSAYKEPRKQVKTSNAVASIIFIIILVLLWTAAPEINFSFALIKALSIISIILFTVFMLINNIPPLKLLVLNLLFKDKLANNETEENGVIMNTDSGKVVGFRKKNGKIAYIDGADTSDITVTIDYPETNRTSALDSPEKMEQYSAANSLRICRESIKIVYETTNPDTFFSRYEIILKEAANIEKFSNKFNFGDLSPQTMRQEVINGKQKYTRDMIDRYWIETYAKAQTLKTDNGKKNRYQKFYDTLEQYKDEMNEDNVRYYTQKYQNAINDLK